MSLLQSEVYRPVDLDFDLPSAPSDNPFAVELKGVATGPGGQRVEIPGFYKGKNTWCIRFSAPVAGDWLVTTLSSVAGLAGHSAKIQAGPQQNTRVHGVLGVDPDRPFHFRYQDGTACFMYGYEVNWLWALDQTSSTTKRLESFLDQIGEAGFNHLMINAYAYDTRWCPGKTEEADFGPPEILPWKGEHGAHDYSHLNLDYWDHFDRMMWVLYERGMDAHIYMKVYNKLVEWPELRSPEEDLYFDYIVARYQAFPNLVWDFAKESYYEEDKEYMADRLARIRRLDAYNHLTTVHDDYYFSYNQPYRKLVDFVTDQYHWERYHNLLSQRDRFQGPIFNAEYGYEHGPDSKPNRTWGQFDPPEESIHRTYEVVLGGGYPAYYYSNHAWDILRWDEMPPTLPAYKRVYEFFTSFDWQAMTPRPDLAQSHLLLMTDEDDEIVVYAPEGAARGRLVVPAKWAGTEWEGYLMDIVTGEKAPVSLTFRHEGERCLIQETSEKKPVVVYLKRVA